MIFFTLARGSWWFLKSSGSKFERRSTLRHARNFVPELLQFIPELFQVFLLMRVLARCKKYVLLELLICKVIILH